MSDSEDQTVLQAKSSPSSSVGALLKATRTRMGQDLKQVSQALRIRQLFLLAIEDGRFDELPGPTYALGFVRSYADFLGLDSEEVVRRFRAETSGISAKKELVFPTPAGEKRLPSGALVAAALALGTLVYGGWYAFSSSSRPVAEAVPEVPDHLVKGGESPSETAKKEEPPVAEAAPAPVEVAKPEEKAAASKAPEPAAAPAKLAETVETPAPKKPEPVRIEPGKTAALAPAQALSAAPAAQGMGGLAISAQPRTVPGPEMKLSAPAAAPSAPPAAATATPPSSETAPSPDAARTPKTYGQAEGEVRVVLKANSDSWVQVRDEKGNLVATRLLKKGDSYRVPTGMGKLSLTTGDAGALSATVDGVMVTPSLGPSGSVRRDIALDPDRIKAGNQ